MKNFTIERVGNLGMRLLLLPFHLMRKPNLIFQLNNINTIGEFLICFFSFVARKFYLLQAARVTPLFEEGNEDKLTMCLEQ